MHRFDRGRTRPLLHTAGLTTAQLAVLETVRDPRTVSALAADLGLSRPAASQLVEKLVRAGLVVRTAEARDRRVRSVALTRRGRGVLTRVSAARAARFAGALDALPRPVAARFRAVLRDVVGTLAVEGRQGPRRRRPPRRAARRRH